MSHSDPFTAVFLILTQVLGQYSVLGSTVYLHTDLYNHLSSLAVGSVAYALIRLGTAGVPVEVDQR